MSQLVAKTMQTALRESQELGLADDTPDDSKQKDKETINTINTIATGSELVTNGENKNGFFSENLKSIQKSKRSIEKAIEKISSQLLLYN